jgi:hypothetical protein
VSQQRLPIYGQNKISNQIQNLVNKTQRNLRTGVSYQNGSTLGVLDRNGGSSSPGLPIQKSRNGGGAAAAVFARNSYSNASSPAHAEPFVNNNQ